LGKKNIDQDVGNKQVHEFHLQFVCGMRFVMGCKAIKAGITEPSMLRLPHSGWHHRAAGELPTSRKEAGTVAACQCQCEIVQSQTAV
jgi:hypothetical protein